MGSDRTKRSDVGPSDSFVILQLNDSITNDINSVNNGVVPIHASVDFGCETDFFFRIEIFLDDVDHTVPVRTGESPVKEEPSSA